jgi:hypothetical protein
MCTYKEPNCSAGRKWTMETGIKGMSNNNEGKKKWRCMSKCWGNRGMSQIWLERPESKVKLFSESSFCFGHFVLNNYLQDRIVYIWRRHRVRSRFAL